MALAHCVQLQKDAIINGTQGETSRKGLKPLVIRNVNEFCNDEFLIKMQCFLCLNFFMFSPLEDTPHFFNIIFMKSHAGMHGVLCNLANAK